jgi:uncharacterized membrane protein
MSSSTAFAAASARCRSAIAEAKRAVAAAEESGASWATAERAEAAVMRASRLQERVEELVHEREAAVEKKERDLVRLRAAFEVRRAAALEWIDSLDVATTDRSRFAELRAAIVGTVLD